MMKTDDQLITLSVIVPCYNVAQYLHNFLCCTEKQWGRHDDYEVIFVNDGSTDATPDILQRFVDRDPRHRLLINQQNGGVSAARNAGIDAARGTWIGFADPDDLIADGAYAYLMDHFLDPETDLLSFEWQGVEEDEMVGSRHDLSLQKENSVVWSGLSNNCKHLIQSAWQCIYRKQVIDTYSIRFNTSLTNTEDVLFNAIILSKNIRVKCLGTKCYYHVIHPYSTTHSLNQEKLKSHIYGATSA